MYSNQCKYSNGRPDNLYGKGGVRPLIKSVDPHTESADEIHELVYFIRSIYPSGRNKEIRKNYQKGSNPPNNLRK